MKQLRVAKSGVNAETVTDPNDFIFHSQYNTFKILEEGSGEYELGDTGDEEEQTIIAVTNSNKFVFGFCKFADGRVGFPGTKAAGVDFWFTRLVIDGTDLLFTYYNGTGGNYTVTFKYIICELPII